jgi:quercetin dioxygenase-like cupin family protein
MGYRDLIPDRQGGRFIASHIRIADAGPVPDYVHHHVIRFQMIYCARGWVRVAYEDQGEPFVLHAGDCVLQPPRIRHRVLEASAGLEVVEIGCPARHDTIADHDLELPTGGSDPGRDFGGQRFARHIAADAVWEPWRVAGLECRDLGIGAATGGLAGARVARPVRHRSGGTDPGGSAALADIGFAHHQAELVFAFVLDGSVSLRRDGGEGGGLDVLTPGDAVVVPAGLDVVLQAWTEDLELLEVTLPDAVEWSVTPEG